MVTNTFLFQGKAEEQPEEPVKSPEPESEESDLGVENRWLYHISPIWTWFWKSSLCLSICLILLFVFLPEIDNEGVIEPDNDDPQEMGDENVEVSTMFLVSVALGKIGRGFEFSQGWQLRGDEYYISYVASCCFGPFSPK